MNCPNDGTTLVMSERQGVEIDYCPKCRGVWLDRGELDKILERSSSELRPRQEYRDDDGDDDRDEERSFGRGRRPKKKRSFLSDLFEFGEE